MLFLFSFILIIYSENKCLSNKSFSEIYSNESLKYNEGINNNEFINDINIFNINNKRKLENGNSDEYRPIKIHVFTEYLRNQLIKLTNPDEEYIDLIISCINRAKDTIEKLINVKKENENNKQYISLKDYGYGINKNISGYDFDNSIVINFYKEVLEADLVILFRKKDDGDRGAEFGFCEVLESDKDHRPRVGNIIYNYLFFTNEERPNMKEETQRQLLSVMFLHEITHILGFNFEVLQTKNMLTTNSSKRIKNKPITKYYVKSEKVLSMAKKYFDCPSIIGVELDNQGNKEELLTNHHWESRLLLGDYMTSEIYYPEQAISEITLALLEDLGWYKPNYYTGGLMRFGKNQGCNFIDEDCFKVDDNDYEKLFSSFPNEFCSNRFSSICSSGRQSRGYCYIKEDNNINATYARNNYLGSYGKEKV